MFRILGFGLLWLAAPIAAQRVQVTQESMHAVSSPLRNLSDNLDNFDVQDQEDDEEVQGPAPVDPVVQTAATIPLATTPLTNMLGLGTGFTGPHGSRPPGGAPPDANAAVGTNQIVETVNLALAVFDKTTGTAVLGPLFMGALWRALDPECSNGANLADPMVLFDKQAQRWIMGIHSLSTPYSACLAVSQTSDATGAYNLYAFQMQSDGRLTELRIGTWPGGYYLATSISNNSVYDGQAACAVDRTKMLAGQSATMECIRITDTRVKGMAPANMDGPIAPPAGSPDYYIAQGPTGSNSLYLYRFHADFVNPEKSTFGGPIEIKVAPYTANNLVPQYGTTQLLHSDGTGMMTPLQYRNFANAAHPYETLVVNHTVQTGTVSNHGTGIRWYELRSPGSTPVVYQQGTYAPDLSYRWMGSIAMDGKGDIAVGYSISTAAAYPSIRYTGRVPSDPPGVMETEATIFNGRGYQSDSDRWGDYTGMSVDPSDDCTMWYTGQYLTGIGSTTWATRLFSFRYPSCQR